MGRDHYIAVAVDEISGMIDCVTHRSHRRDQDTFGWVCHHGDLEIDFDKNGSPFQKGLHHFAAPAHARTQPLAVVDPLAGVDDGEKQYHYNVKVTLPNGNVCQQYPQVILDEGRVLDEVKVLESTVGGINDAAKQVLDELFEKLKDGVALKADPTRLFFPNGIELISVDVELGPAKVIIKVAGSNAD
jgi:hypothetical protein